MKKLINKIGIITFILSPIVTIALAPSSSPASDSPQFKLTQSFKTKLKKSFKNSKWVEQTKINSGSKITDGKRGTIFEDSRGNLWSMGKGTPLQKYDYQTKRWTTKASERSDSNINDGWNGIIFEDSRGNLWSMGNRSPLQKYDYQSKRWTTETRENSGSNINDGWGGTIFEDSRGNLWSMAYKTMLQKYDYQTKIWTTETRKNSGSNITDGNGGIIFEDSRGNLWSMGNKTRLQKYDYQTKRWSAQTGINGKPINNGNGATIFEDSQGNLWSMGNGHPLTKYDYQTKKWTQEYDDRISEEDGDEARNSGSNIIDGYGGTIFEDSRGNLWSMGYETPLQKYNYQTKRWTTETSKNSGSNIKDGYYGNIFEDSLGNLWSMGEGTPLQKYNYTTKRWTEETSAISGSHITNGEGGTIFEDSRGNLWSMGKWNPLKKLVPIEITNPANQPTKNYNLTFQTRIISNSKVSLSIQGYYEYKSNLFSYLKYKKKTKGEWKVVKNKILSLDRANYEFRWVLGVEETLAGDQKFPQEIIIKSDGSIGTITSFRQMDIAKVKTFLSGLSNLDISSLAIATKLVSALTNEEVLEQIKLASGYSLLTKDQQALITKDLISLSEDPAGILKVTITFKGETYELIKGGFKLTLQGEANKFKDFISMDSTKSNAASLKVSSKNVLNIFKKISGYQKPDNLANDIAITKAIVKNELNPQTQKVTFELNISRQDEVVKKDVIVTFRSLKAIAKSSKKGLSELTTGAIVGIILGSIFGMGIIVFLTFYLVRRNKK